MILALSATGPVTRMWLIKPGQPAPSESTLEWESGRQLADQLLGRILDLLKEHDTSLNDLTGCVLESGPGSFTSLRIGHATVNALAAGLDIPVVGARGADWLSDGLSALKDAESGVPALPFYGSEAHITERKS